MQQPEGTLHALYQASLQIQGRLGMQDRLSHLIRTAQEVLRLDRVHILLADREGQWLEGVASTGTDEPLEALQIPIGPEAGGLAQAYLTQKAILWDGHAPVPETLRIKRPYDRIKAFRSRVFAIVPLIVEGRALGVLGVDRKRSRLPLEPATLELLQLFAAQAAVAIENARLFTSAEQRAGELATLQEVGQAITAQLELSRVLEAVVTGAMQFLGSQHTQVLLWDEANQTLRYGAARGAEAERVRTQRLQLGRGINGTVAMTRQPMILDDYQASPYALPEFPDIVATITTPILFGDRLLGVLHSHTTQAGRRFTPDDLRHLQMLAAQAAIAIENARLHEEALTQKGRLTQIFDSTSDGILLVGPMGRIESANRRAGELLGFSPETIVGLGLADLMSDQFREGGDYRHALTAFRSALLGGQDGDKEGDLSLPSVRRVLHWVARPTKDSLGAPTGLTLTFQDVTREREADQMKSDFVSFATHQLRTPLAGIKWMLELAAQEPGVPQEAGSFIQDARASAERLIRLVNDLLDVSRLERGKLTISSQIVRLGSLTDSVLEEVALLIKEKGHTLSVDGADQVSPVLADPQLLRQAILNLVSNAIKYTLPGGQIAIRMTQDGDMVCWAIRDSGVGIPPEAQHRLFEKFYRAENVLTIETEGTGLGLYLVRLLVERLGGRVWCESEEGQGATFFFTLRRTG